MLPRLAEAVQTLLALTLTGLAIKFMDDHLDQELDAASGVKNWALWLGPGVMPYALLFLSLATAVRPALSLPLFLAAYALGMIRTPLALNPSGLAAIWETALVFLLGVFLFGWRPVLWAFSFLGAVQIADDLLDQSSPAHLLERTPERPAGRRLSFGRFSFEWEASDRVEKGLALIVLLLFSLRLSRGPTVAGLVAAAGIMIASAVIPRLPPAE